MTTPARRPDRGLFRYVGGKSYMVDQLAPKIRAHLNATGGRLISPFYGSGAIERAVGGEQIAADAIPELLGLFEDLQRLGPERVHRALVEFDRKVGRTRKSYEAVREMAHLQPPARSARFLWLSTMAFNGIWRVNARGGMNMPPDPARLARADALPGLDAAQSFAQEIALTRFSFGWFSAIAQRKPGDLVLADPPYMGKGAFRSYTATGFPDVDQRFLAVQLRSHAENGGAVIAFNSPAARHLYGWARVEDGERAGTISSDGDGRDAVGELIITSGLQAQEIAA